MTPVMTGFIGVVICFVLMFLRMPIALAFTSIGFGGIWYLRSLPAALNAIGTIPYATMTMYVWTVAPLFILMGYLAMHTDIAREFYLGVSKWVGHFRGGLATTTILGSAGFGAASGDVIGAAVTFSAISLPEMRRFGYADSLTLGTVAAGSNLSILLPPSIAFILYGAITEVSIGKLFIAGIVPGLMLMLCFVGVVYFQCRMNPRLGPPGECCTWTERCTSCGGMWGVIVIFTIIIGGLYVGIFTPTEAAAVGAFTVLAMGVIRRKLSVKGFKAALVEAGLTTAMVGLLLVGASVFNLFVVLTGLPRVIAAFILGFNLPPIVIMVIILFIFFILGTFMDALAMVLLMVPIFFPVIVKLGFDPIHFGVLVTMMMTIGHVTPPFGIVCFAISGVARDVSLMTIFRGVAPFLYAMVAVLILALFFPELSLFLPRLMMG